MNGSSFSNRFRKKNFIFTLVLVKIVLCTLALVKFESSLRHNNILDELNVSLSLYDLTEPNIHAFECIKTARFSVETTICLHNSDEDAYVSQTIKTKGVWEPRILELFINVLVNAPDLQVFDIGAHVGQYTLFAAKLNRTVVSVEPFYDNFKRLHRAALLENTTANIILVTNGISDERGQIRSLSKSETNIGGQKVIASNDKTVYSESDLDNNKYLLKTIVMDDLTNILPVDFAEAIIKIDIENYEIKAFKEAKKLFDKVKIHVVFMEWNEGGGVKASLPDNQVNRMFDFFYAKQFICMDLNLNSLDRRRWKVWPGFVIWFNTNSQYDLDFLFKKNNFS